MKEHNNGEKMINEEQFVAYINDMSKYKKEEYS